MDHPNLHKTDLSSLAQAAFVSAMAVNGDEVNHCRGEVAQD